MCPRNILVVIIEPSLTGVVQHNSSIDKKEG